MKNKTQHTSTPWFIYPKDNGEALIGNAPHPVAWVAVKKDYEFEPLAKANARFIVRAVNNHEALLGACKDNNDLADSYLKWNGENSNERELLNALRIIRERNKQAMAQVPAS